MPVLNAALQLSSTHTYTQPMFNHARKNHSTNNHTTKMLFKRSGVSYTPTTNLKKCKLIKNKIKNQQYLTKTIFPIRYCTKHAFMLQSHHYILQDQYLFLSVHLSQKKKKNPQGTKYCDQHVHFFDVTPYIISTHPVFLCLY